MKLNKKKYANQPTAMKKSYINEADIDNNVLGEQERNNQYGMGEALHQDQSNEASSKSKQ